MRVGPSIRRPRRKSLRDDSTHVGMSAGDSSAVFFDDDIVGFGFGLIGLEVSALEAKEAALTPRKR